MKESPATVARQSGRYGNGNTFSLIAGNTQNPASLQEYPRICQNFVVEALFYIEGQASHSWSFKFTQSLDGIYQEITNMNCSEALASSYLPQPTCSHLMPSGSQTLLSALGLYTSIFLPDSLFDGLSDSLWSFTDLRFSLGTRLLWHFLCSL